MSTGSRSGTARRHLHRGRGEGLLAAIAEDSDSGTLGSSRCRVAARRARRFAVVRRRPRGPNAVDGEQPGSAGGKAVENDPKSVTSRRTLPLPDRLVFVLRSRQDAAGRRAAGPRPRWRRVGVRREQRGRRAVHPRCCRGIGGMPSRRRACGRSSCTRRGTPRHGDAPCRRAGRSDRRMDRAQGRNADHAPLRALPGRRFEGRR